MREVQTALLLPLWQQAACEQSLPTFQYARTAMLFETVRRLSFE